MGAETQPALCSLSFLHLCVGAGVSLEAGAPLSSHKEQTVPSHAHPVCAQKGIHRGPV